MLVKDTIPLVLEHSVLLDFRRILFKHGLNPQKFLAFLVRKTITHDDRLLQLLREALVEISEEETKSGKKIKSLNADEIYALIEQK